MANRHLSDRDFREAVLRRDKYRCHYCQIRLARDTFTLDHIVPRKLGGSSAHYNLVASCFPCNQVKADRDVWCFCTRCGNARARHYWKPPRRLDVPDCGCVRCAQVQQYG